MSLHLNNGRVSSLFVNELTINEHPNKCSSDDKKVNRDYPSQYFCPFLSKEQQTLAALARDLKRHLPDLERIVLSTHSIHPPMPENPFHRKRESRPCTSSLNKLLCRSKRMLPSVYNFEVLTPDKNQ